MKGLAIALAVAALACRSTSPTTARGPMPTPTWQSMSPVARVVPAPVSVAMDGGSAFALSATTSIVIDPGNPNLARAAEIFAAVLRPSTGFAVPVMTADTGTLGKIALRLGGDTTEIGAEGYQLSVSRDSIRLTAGSPAGIFHGLQTLRQLLPPAIESHLLLSSADWRVPALRITDKPRLPWRGAMLDVSRHFFTVDEVKQYIDMLALYKLNVLHLHLSDDQGWRIEVKSRPRLTAAAAGSEVGGGEGGFYTQAQYADIVRYAGERHITVVPEIDMPGHTNAALVAYPDLSCSTRPTAIYTGTEVGWSTFCVDKEETYALIDDIVREIAAITPGAYFHIGGDEVEALTPEQYARFVERAQAIVARHGKRTIGWEEIAKARLLPTTVVQLWRSDTGSHATQQGAKLVLSPSPKTYLDMKYNATTELGLTWAALIEVRDAYEWDPATYAKGASERDVIGVEAPLWSETIRSIAAAQYLALPRLPALAEVGWTPQSLRNWEGFRQRIAAHGPRWNLLGYNYYRAPQIWP
jgi:hexosaminidase